MASPVVTITGVNRTFLTAPATVSLEDALALRTAGLDLLIAGSLSTSGASNLWPAQDVAALAAHQQRAVAHELLETQLLSGLLASLRESGVACLLLKGVALARTHYPVSWWRLRSDIDLLIASDRFATTNAALQKIGWRALTEPAEAIVSGQRHFVHATSTTPPLDLHLRLLAPALPHAPEFEELWTDRRGVDGLGEAAWTLADHHALWYACVHRALHHPGDDRPLWLFDIDRLARTLDAQGWSALTALATRTQTRRVCADGLDRAADCFDTPLPADTLASWRVVDGERSAAFLSAQSDLGIQWRNLKMMRGWRERASLFRAHLFPDAGYMRERFHARGPLALLLAYARRAATGAARWIARSARRPR